MLAQPLHVLCSRLGTDQFEAVTILRLRCGLLVLFFSHVHLHFVCVGYSHATNSSTCVLLLVPKAVSALVLWVAVGILFLMLNQMRTVAVSASLW